MVEVGRRLREGVRVRGLVRLELRGEGGMCEGEGGGSVGCGVWSVVEVDMSCGWDEMGWVGWGEGR